MEFCLKQFCVPREGVHPVESIFLIKSLGKGNMQSCLLKAYLHKNERDSFGIINDHMHYQKRFSSSGN